MSNSMSATVQSWPSSGPARSVDQTTYNREGISTPSTVAMAPNRTALAPSIRLPARTAEMKGCPRRGAGAAGVIRSAGCWPILSDLRSRSRTVLNVSMVDLRWGFPKHSPTEMRQCRSSRLACALLGVIRCRYADGLAVCVASAMGALRITTYATVNCGLPLMAVRTLPPHRLVGPGRDLIRCQTGILRRMPLLGQGRRTDSEVVLW